jgi:hypothetical protein
VTSLVKRFLGSSLRRFGIQRATASGAGNAHRALRDLYEDADGTSGWRLSLLAFTASHLERHGLSRSQREALRVALTADPETALAALERLHNLAHGGAFQLRRRTRV